MVCSTDNQFEDGVKDGKKAMGNLGEGFARGYLSRRGFEILEAPFRCKSGEIDIIAMEERTLVFVEVKTRRSRSYGHPLEAVTPAKQRKIARVAQVYLTYYNRREFDFCRFDVLGIDAVPSTGENKVHHIRNAFVLGE